MKKNRLKMVIITFGLLILFFSVLHLFGRYSEPYKAAEEYIRSNQDIRAGLGEVKDMRLTFLGYAIQYSGVSGKADFVIDVNGNKSTGTVYIKLVKEMGVWNVSSARLRYDNDDLVDINT